MLQGWRYNPRERTPLRPVLRGWRYRPCVENPLRGRRCSRGRNALFERRREIPSSSGIVVNYALGWLLRKRAAAAAFTLRASCVVRRASCVARVNGRCVTKDDAALNWSVRMRTGGEVGERGTNSWKTDSHWMCVTSKSRSRGCDVTSDVAATN